MEETTQEGVAATPNEETANTETAQEPVEETNQGQTGDVQSESPAEGAVDNDEPVEEGADAPADTPVEAEKAE